MLDYGNALSSWLDLRNVMISWYLFGSFATSTPFIPPQTTLQKHLFTPRDGRYEHGPYETGCQKYVQKLKYGIKIIE